MNNQTIDGLSRKEVEYNVFAMAKTMARIERKLERARSEKVITKLKRQYFDEKIGWESNVRRLAKFNDSIGQPCAKCGQAIDIGRRLCTQCQINQAEVK